MDKTMSIGKKGHNYRVQQVYSINKSQERKFMSFYVLIIACLFYSMGSFGLLNIFGVRRLVQSFLIISVLPLTIIIIARFQILIKSPLFLLLLVFVFAELIFERSSMVLLDNCTAIIVIGLLLSINREYSNKILKYIIIICCVFSIMSIIQAVIVFFRPDIIPFLSPNYTSISETERIILQHPLGVLGFTVFRGEVYLFGRIFTRFVSFAAEPSVLVYSFLVPGILALSFKGNIRYCSIPILFFSIFLSQSGTIWLSVSFGVVSWVMFQFLKGKARFVSIIPFFIIVLIFTFLSQTEISVFVKSIMGKLGSLPEHYSALYKYSSGNARLESIVYAFRLSKQYILMGAPFIPELTGVGFLLILTISAGFIGLSLGIIVFYRIFKLSVSCFSLYKGITGLMAALLFGTLFQILLFSHYGWNRFPGLLMITLLMCRLEILIINKTEEDLISVKVSNGVI
ncbi:hypothetical protein ACFL9T_10090 [Thermodesulfobacteriota bacterium]